MAEDTKIQWCDHTFNMLRGCEKKKLADGSVHPGCVNCYAEVDRSVRIHNIKWGSEAIGGTRVRNSDAEWKQPLKWNRAAGMCSCQREAGDDGPLCGYCQAARMSNPNRPRVFVSSLGDVFEDWSGPILDHKGNVIYRTVDGVDDFRSTAGRPLTINDVRSDLFKLIDATPNLDWLLLTKRPENVRRMWPGIECEYDSTTGDDDPDRGFCGYCGRRDHDYRHNVFLGTSVSDQPTADEMVPELLNLRDLSPCLFLSCEPLLGPIDLRRIPTLRSAHKHKVLFEKLWVLIGGESGPKARPCSVDWIRSLVRQCRDAGTAAFCKQLGSFILADEPQPSWRYDGEDKSGQDAYRCEHPKGGDESEFPSDLQGCREFPKVEVRA